MRRRRRAAGGAGAPPLGRASRVKVAILLLAGVAAVGPMSAAWVEQVYSRGFYGWLQPRLTALTNRVPLSMLDVLGALVGIGLLLWWVVRLRRAARGRILRTVIGLSIDTAVVCASTYLLFLLTWGLNYRREPLQNTLDFREDRITREALRELASRTIGQLNLLSPGTARRSWPELPDVPQLVLPGFERVQRQLGVVWAVSPGVPKRSLLNAYFTSTAIDGMTDPFFLETLINQDLLPFERPFVVAHEWGHLAGFANESEANFVGWLTCMQGPGLARYSAWLSLYGTVMAALTESERAELAASVLPGPRRDLRAIADRIARQSAPIARRASAVVYDRFLKANRVGAGIASYSAVVRLILGTRFSTGDVPVLRRH